MTHNLFRTQVASSTTVSARWYQAITLAERINLFQTQLAHPLLPSQAQRDYASSRLAQWKNAPAFQRGRPDFAGRLAADALDEDALAFLLAQSPGEVQAAFSTLPPWLAELLAAFAHEDTTTFASLPPLTVEDPQTRAVFQTIKPLVLRSFLRLQDGLADLQARYSHLPFDPYTLLPLLFPHILSRLAARMTRTLVLELNVARVEGRLVGATPAARFDYFLAELAQPARMLAFLEEYPVLARYLVDTLTRWTTCELELFQRLCADWDDLCTLFSPHTPPGILVAIREGAGDTHQGGRSVTMLTWSSGLRLVYKPRSMAIDVHFQALLTWLNDHGCQPTFHTLQLLDRADYGWCEFLSPNDCSTTTEIERFYQRLGAYLALFYALEATDFHAQNLIAVGEHPMPIDLEALFHPRVDGAALTEDTAYAVIKQSVLRVGLLPERFWTSEDNQGIDLSAMSAQTGQVIPFPIATWQATGTDEMHMTQEQMAIQMDDHRPTLQGQAVEPLDYDKNVITGFTTVYRLLLQHRTELLSDLLLRFAHDEVRAILRPTQRYVMLQTDSFHPNVLRDALERERLLDRLWTATDITPATSSIIAAERAALLQEDIPKFTAQPATRDLSTPLGEIIPAFFYESSLDLARKCIASLNEHDLERQVWIIRASLAGLVLSSRPAHSHGLTLQPTSEPATEARLLQAACTIGDRLHALALVQPQSIGWLGLTLVNGYEWRPTPAGLDLYTGLPGIALFLAYLGQLSNKTHFTSLAQLTLRTVLAQAEQMQSYAPRKTIGAFDGAGSLIYLFAHLGTIWHTPELYREAEKVVAQLPDLIANDEFYDVLNGSAGCIAALLSLYTVAPSSLTLNAALQCGDHLLTQALVMPTGIGWKHSQAQVPLTGMSHGNAGIALNLLRLYGLSRQERFLTGALAALDYERSLFSSEKNNWPDLRKATSPTPEAKDISYMTAWCHGASGIGLARLASLPYHDDPTTRTEIDAAIQTTLAEGFGLNHSLCHGDLGNLDFLLTATRRLPERYSRTRLEPLQASLLASMEDHTWLSGVPLEIETPGLLVGLAGTGYALLRQLAPDRVPSVLELAPPFFS